VSHPSNFDDRSVDGDASSTRLTVVPCGRNFDAEVPDRVTLSIQITTEFEQLFSASTTVQCWADFDLGEVTSLFERDNNGANWLQTRLSVANSPAGIMLLQQTVHEHARPATFTAVATTAHHKGTGDETDLIVVPEVAP
jgi:hypothetical protein